jgi:hypothetical protein
VASQLRGGKKACWNVAAKPGSVFNPFTPPSMLVSLFGILQNVPDIACQVFLFRNLQYVPDIACQVFLFRNLHYVSDIACPNFLFRILQNVNGMAPIFICTSKKLGGAPQDHMHFLKTRASRLLLEQKNLFLRA